MHRIKRFNGRSPIILTNSNDFDAIWSKNEQQIIIKLEVNIMVMVIVNQFSGQYCSIAGPITKNFHYNNSLDVVFHKIGLGLEKHVLLDPELSKT